MKKLLAGFLVGLIVGLVLSAVNWKAFLLFSNCTYGVASPDIEPNISHFRTKVPQFSSNHFFFREGFMDVDEYWSFELPPELARVFLDSYVKMNSLQAISQNSDLPDWIKRSSNHKDWRSDLWFKSYADLSKVYYKKYLFCGYDAKKNRIYLMNWND
jgi:hypothetical protein